MRLFVASLIVLVLLCPRDANAFDLFSKLMKVVQEGNKDYKDKHYEKALDKYEKAESQLQREPRIHFNKGNALFKLGRMKEARDAYLRAMGTKNKNLKKRNYFNIGNTFLHEKNFQDAITYYRRALEMDPEYDDARYNLELAMMALEQQKNNSSGDRSNKDKDQQDKDQKNKDQKDKDQQNKDQQNKDQKDKDQKDKDQQNKDQQNKDQQNKDQQDKDQQNKDQQDKDQQNKDQQDKDQQNKDQQNKDQQDKEQQNKEQQNKEQQNKDQQDKDQQNKDQQDKEQQNKDQQNNSKAMPAPSQTEKKKPGELTKAQILDLLKSESQNEKPFQMQRFLLPEFKREDKNVDKDW